MSKKSKEMDEQFTAIGLDKKYDRLDVSNNNLGIIYVMVNQAMPGYVKIGKAENIDARISSLFREL